MKTIPGNRRVLVKKVATDEPTPVATFDITESSSTKVLIQASSKGRTHISELLIAHNGSEAFSTEYGVIHTQGKLYKIQADVSLGKVRIVATNQVEDPVRYVVMLTI